MDMAASSRFGRKSQIGFVLLAALAIEAVNFFLGSLAVDPGSEGTQWYVNLLALQWAALHALGIFMTDGVDRLGFPGLDVPVLFLGGFLTTAVVLAALVFLVQRLVRWIGRPERRRRRRRRSTL